MALPACAPLLAPTATAFAPPASAGQATPANASTGIHPAVARIVAPGDGSISYGSGTLVYADDVRGVVVTNWHVVNEATGPVSVHFPNGFYSLGTVQMIDRDWDLAAILIRKPPNVRPVPIAERPPQPGEMLTIAGYGSGQYRAASGPCTQYVAPGLKFPYEMVELAASARQGDSGGPIFNSRGELAGVLFGEGNGRTSGSYCGRVHWFLTSVVPRLPRDSTMVAAGQLQSLPRRPGTVGSTVGTLQPAAVAQTAAAPASTAGRPMAPPPQQAWPSVSSPSEVERGPVVASTRSSGPQVEVVQIGWHDIAGDTLGEQVKTVLAGVGVLAVLLQALRWISREGTST